MELIIFINKLRSTHKAWISDAAQRMLHSISWVFAQSIAYWWEPEWEMRKMRDYWPLMVFLLFFYSENLYSEIIAIADTVSPCRHYTHTHTHYPILSSCTHWLSSIHEPNVDKNYTIAWTSNLCTRIYSHFIVVCRRCHATISSSFTYPISLLFNVEYVRRTR